MRRPLTMTLLVLILACLTVWSVFADAPRFIIDGAPEFGSPDLHISFAEVGLGRSANVTIVFSGFATSTYACINNGGRNPSAANKQSFSGLVSESQSYVTDASGRIKDSMTLYHLGPNGFACPRGQKLELVEVTFTNVTLEDVTNGVREVFPGPFVQTLYNLP